MVGEGKTEGMTGPVVDGAAGETGVVVRTEDVDVVHQCSNIRHRPNSHQDRRHNTRHTKGHLVDMGSLPP
jgi:hypothetical protein